MYVYVYKYSVCGPYIIFIFVSPLLQASLEMVHFWHLRIGEEHLGDDHFSVFCWNSVPVPSSFSTLVWLHFEIRALRLSIPKITLFRLKKRAEKTIAYMYMYMSVTIAVSGR